MGDAGPIARTRTDGMGYNTWKSKIGRNSSFMDLKNQQKRNGHDEAISNIPSVIFYGSIKIVGDLSLVARTYAEGMGESGGISVLWR